MKKILFLALIMFSLLLVGCKSLQDKPAKQNQVGDSSSSETQEFLDADIILDEKFFNDATISLNLKTCDKIAAKQRKEECKSIIDSLKLSSEAASKKDKSICEKIKLDRYREKCQLDTEQLIKKFEEVKNVEKIYQEAIVKNDVKICESLEESQQSSCRYNALIEQAQKEKNPKICEKIGDNFLVETCKNLIESF